MGKINGKVRWSTLRQVKRETEEKKKDKRITKADEKRFAELYEPAIKAMAEALGRIALEVDPACLVLFIQHSNRMFTMTNSLIRQQLQLIEQGAQNADSAK